MPAPTCTNDITPSYEIRKDGQAIRFSPCGTVSYNLNDVRNFYCSRCKRFMNDLENLKRRTQEWVKP